jgi:hypothetical protein
LVEKAKLKVLYVDDEEDNLLGFRLNYEDFWEITTELDPAPVMADGFGVERFDVVVADLVFNVKNGVSPHFMTYPDPEEGLRLVSWMQKYHPEIPVVVLSAIMNPGNMADLIAIFPKILVLDKPYNDPAGFPARIEGFVLEYRKRVAS